VAFDGNEYRKTVLKALDADFSRADPETGDVFYVLALDPALDAEADDDAAITVRLDEIVAFWQKQRSAPKFRDTAEALVRRKDAYREVMTDPSRRREARGRVLAQRSRADTDRMARLDETADRLEKSYGGIPADRVERLRAMAAREDVDATAFTAWLARRRVLGTLDDAAAPPWDPSVRHQIRTTLNRAARVTGDAATFATLFSFLGLTPEASVATLRHRHDEFFAELDQARHNRIRTLIADLLAQVKTRLAVDGGPAAYRASLIADAADEISSGVEDAGIVSGQVDAREYDALVARIVGLGWGIPTPDARGVVRRVAAAQGVAVEVSTDGSAVHYEVSAVAGRRSSPPARSGVCRVVKDLAGLRAEVEVVTDGRARASDGQVVVLTWPPLGGVAEVVVDRTVRAGDDGEDAVTRATRRFRRRDASDLVDDGCEIGVRYAYRAWVEYPGDAGQVTRTPGRTVEVTLTERPRPVRELWAATGDDGATTVSFGAARAGEVRVYASPPGSPWSPGTEEVSLADLDRAASGARVRLVGAGRRRVVDRAGRGAVHYTSVTVVGDRARPGAQLDHQAVGRPTDLAVRPGPGAGEVLLTFELPAGVTEAMVCWRVGESPSGPEDPLAAGGRVTNTKLQIDGGYTVALPPGPDAVLATVYPMVRPAGGRPVAVGQGATVTLRESGAGRVGGAAVSWELRRPTNPFRRTFRVVVRSRSDGGVPGIAVVAAPGTSAPTSLEAGHLMGRAVAGEGRETTVTVDGRALPAATSALAVFLVDGDDRPLHPPGTVEPPVDPTITV